MTTIATIIIIIVLHYMAFALCVNAVDFVLNLLLGLALGYYIIDG